MCNRDGLVRALLSIDQGIVVLFPFKFSHEVFHLIFNKTTEFESIVWEPIC